ncbi:MAG: hypothetical protein H0X73_05385 [Chthoniobacterales bacterium]|nr:hypothetical protein [Chthoniobacterales bacterium]
MRLPSRPPLGQIFDSREVQNGEFFHFAVDSVRPGRNTNEHTPAENPRELGMRNLMTRTIREKEAKRTKGGLDDAGIMTHQIIPASG